jgi:uncharacterized membrane protein
MATVDGLVFGLTLVAALGCGLIAGVFFAFSSFVMRALGRLPPSGGAAAMQWINVVVLNPVFLGVFVGTAVVCVLVLVAALLRWNDHNSVYMLVGGCLVRGRDVPGDHPVQRTLEQCSCGRRCR